MWIVKIRQDPGSQFFIKEHTKICSDHFTADDFVNYLECPLTRPRLKPTAVPSISPWTIRTHKRTSTTSTIACSAIQRYDYHTSCTPSVDESSADRDEQYTDYVECMNPLISM